MRGLVVALMLLVAEPAHATDRRTAGKALVGVGIAGLVVVTTALAIVGSWGNSGNCAERSSADTCHAMMLAGDTSAGILGPLSAAMIVAGGVIYDRSSESPSAATLRIRF